MSAAHLAFPAGEGASTEEMGFIVSDISWAKWAGTEKWVLLHLAFPEGEVGRHRGNGFYCIMSSVYLCIPPQLILWLERRCHRVDACMI